MANRIFLDAVKTAGAFLYSNEEPDLVPVSQDEYRELFLAKDQSVIKSAYEKAWAAKNFEIENLWRRAAYSWAFQVASFAGYFAVLNSSTYAENAEILYFVICIGFVTALAWSLINVGSRTWQRHWENHVDMLEDGITGPLYKVTSGRNTYSVSKINELVSFFITAIWILLAVKYFAENSTLNPRKSGGVDWLVVLSSATVLVFASAMLFGRGRGRFGPRRARFRRRRAGEPPSTALHHSVGDAPAGER